jgi:hypothetical protein
VGVEGAAKVSELHDASILRAKMLYRLVSILFCKEMGEGGIEWGLVCHLGP